MDINKNNSNSGKDGDNKNEQFKKSREIDVAAQDIGNWWRKTYVFIKKTQVKTWQGVFVISFFAGAAAAVIWTVSLRMQTSSTATGEMAYLALQSGVGTIQKDGTFTADIILNTNGSAVVVAKTVVNYIPQDFQLTAVDTQSGIFGVAECPAGSSISALCAIVDRDNLAGKVTVTVAKPSPGVTSSSGKIAGLTFKALRSVAPIADNIKLSYLSSGDYTDSDVILKGDSGADILDRVTNLRMTVSGGNEAVTCSSHSYSDWTPCQLGSQSRTLVSSLPDGCSGGEPVAALTQSCYEPAEACEFEYSDWGICQSNNTQTRTVISTSPEGCSGENTETLSRSCSQISLKLSTSSKIKSSKLKLAVTTVKKERPLVKVYVNDQLKGTYRADKKGKLSKNITVNRGANIVRVDAISGSKSSSISKTVIRTK